MQLKLKKILILSTLMICILAYSAVAMAMSFSAEIVSFDGKAVTTGKFYMTNDKIRVEYAEMANIIRMDKKVMWMLMLKDKIYMEQVFNPAAVTKQNQIPRSDTEAAPVDEIEKVFILRETINGYVSDKYKVTVKNQGSHYIWESSDPGIRMQVKAAAINGSWWQEYRNISLAEPAASLFEIPPYFTKMNMQGMPGMFMRP